MTVDQIADQIEAWMKETGHVCPHCGKIRMGNIEEEHEIELEPLEVPVPEKVPA